MRCGYARCEQHDSPIPILIAVQRERGKLRVGSMA